MRNYLKLAPKYLSAHKRKTRLAVVSVALAVTLVAGIFSLLDSEVKFQKAQVLKNEGNYHILIRKPSREEMDFIKNRIDVEKAGSFMDLGEGVINGERCAFGALDGSIAKNLNFELAQGTYCKKANEIMLEKWFVEKSKPVLKPGDTVRLTLENGKAGEYLISGIYNDLGATKAAGVPGVLLSMDAASQLTPKSDDFFILFKKGVSVVKAENEIKKALNIKDDRIARNEALLALSLQSRNNKVLSLYLVGAVLFILVLVTGVVMIYNTFNISVMDRVRQFGLLRCIGASPAQIKRLVRREGFAIAVRAIPIGVLAGMLMTFACSFVLKYYNKNLYGGIPLFNFSAAGIVAGVVIGFLTVYIASLLPARKAARVSPVNALKAAEDTGLKKRKKLGLLMKLFPAQFAIGANSALNKKKTIILMAASIAFSITLFMGFNALAKPEYMGMTAIKAYTADISLTSRQGISEEVYRKLSGMDGVKRVYGRMDTFVNATFDASRLTGLYRKDAGEVRTDNNGLIASPEKTLLVSYDAVQMKWAKEYLSYGEIDENRLNTQNGIIAVRKIWRNHSLMETSELEVGDKVYIKTARGTKVYTVMGVCNSAPYGSDDLTMTTFITTEKLFAEITGDTSYKTVDIQLKSGNRENTVSKIKTMAGSTLKVLDKRQLNSQARSAYVTGLVFIYGFVGIIALISVLNIINTMNTSVAAKTRYMGIMRAVGMSGSQLSGMVIVEAAIYTLVGCAAGCTLGIMLQKTLTNWLRGDWKFPLVQVAVIFTVCMLTAVFSAIRPLKRVKAGGISETIASL